MKTGFHVFHIHTCKNIKVLPPLALICFSSTSKPRKSRSRGKEKYLCYASSTAHRTLMRDIHSPMPLAEKAV